MTPIETVTPMEENNFLEEMGVKEISRPYRRTAPAFD
jgi:hypothetical protein